MLTYSQLFLGPEPEPLPVPAKARKRCSIETEAIESLLATLLPRSKDHLGHRLRTSCGQGSVPCSPFSVSFPGHIMKKVKTAILAQPRATLKGPT